jgi:hypothetical protein
MRDLTVPLGVVMSLSNEGRGHLLESAISENPLCPNPKERDVFSDFPLGIKGKKSLKLRKMVFRIGFIGFKVLK